MKITCNFICRRRADTNLQGKFNTVWEISNEIKIVLLSTVFQVRSILFHRGNSIKLSSSHNAGPLWEDTTYNWCHRRHVRDHYIQYGRQGHCHLNLWEWIDHEQSLEAFFSGIVEWDSMRGEETRRAVIFARVRSLALDYPWEKWGTARGLLTI